MSDVPQPAVPPSAYDETYYREWCAGSDEWVESDGLHVSGIYPGFLTRAGLQPGEVVVDMGTGRGELLVTAIRMGAAHAYGVEYSPDAVKMAVHTAERHGMTDRVDVLQADARSVPLPDGIADLVCFVDVVEHLTQHELHAALLQAKRMVKPGGRIVAHTMPNRLIYDVTYRAQRMLPGRRDWPANPRVELERVMHVNEHTVFSLRKAFRAAGLDADVQLGDWVYTQHVPTRGAKRTYKLLSRLGPLAHLGLGDIWAFGRLPAT